MTIAITINCPEHNTPLRIEGYWTEETGFCDKCCTNYNICKAQKRSYGFTLYVKCELVEGHSLPHKSTKLVSKSMVGDPATELNENNEWFLNHV